MITVYQLPPAFDLPVSVSPYCTKLEIYLRLTGREYSTAMGDIRKSPNRKVPYVTGVPGHPLLADSRTIVQALEADGDLDAGITETERAASERLETLVQMDIYYPCLYARFVDPAGWVFQKPTVRSLVPGLLAPILVPVIRSSQVKLCKRNGFIDDTGYARATSAIARVAETLGDSPFMLGEQPRIVDCTVWANVMHTAYTRSANPARDAVRGSDRLMAYIERMAKRAGLSLPQLN